MDEASLRRGLNEGVLALDVEDILRILPHRPPMLLIDRIISLVPGRHAVGIKVVTGNEYGLATRRTGFIFPSTFAVEALGQLAAVSLLYSEKDGAVDEEGVSTVRLAAVERLETHQEMVEGGRLDLATTILRRRSGWARVHGIASLLGRPYIEAVFTLAVEPSLNGGRERPK